MAKRPTWIPAPDKMGWNVATKFLKINVEYKLTETPVTSDVSRSYGVGAAGSIIKMKAAGMRGISVGIGPRGVGASRKKFSAQTLRDIATRVKSVWEDAAKIELGSDQQALQEYLRAIRVEVKSGRGVLIGLEGWEAVSRDLGWAPMPGGLSAGIGKYTGAIHDMKPLILNGAKRKVIPMILTGTKGEILDLYKRQFEESIIGLKRPSEGWGESVGGVPARQGKEGRDWHRLAFTEAAQEITDFAFNASKMKGRTSVTAGRGRKLPSFHPGPGEKGDFRDKQARPGRGFTKSLLEGAVPVASSKRVREYGTNKVTKRGPTKSFIVFRTVTDGSYNPNEAKPGRRRTRASAQRERTRRRRAEAMKKKWLTAGRKGIDLMRRIQLMLTELIKSQVAYLERWNADIEGKPMRHHYRAEYQSVDNAEKMADILLGRKRGFF
jgi:hypothetical protein